MGALVFFSNELWITRLIGVISFELI